mmetsp:Transcript_13406/g.26612  ORF Transcript_13406/g.26612 Transcript_13406/m.26612 type:complete len:156 (+) Transcript_13406:1586-2053(+)
MARPSKGVEVTSEANVTVKESCGSRARTKGATSGRGRGGNKRVGCNDRGAVEAVRVRRRFDEEERKCGRTVVVVEVWGGEVGMGGGGGGEMGSFRLGMGGGSREVICTRGREEGGQEVQTAISNNSGRKVRNKDSQGPSTPWEEIDIPDQNEFAQ